MIQLKKELKIKCPCCNEDILVYLESDILSVSELQKTDEQEVKELLSKLNIELG